MEIDEAGISGGLFKKWEICPPNAGNVRRQHDQLCKASEETLAGLATKNGA